MPIQIAIFIIAIWIVIILLILDKEERNKKYRSMTSQERQVLILKKMKAKGIEVGSGVSNKRYDSEDVYELIHIVNCFPELREKRKVKN